MYSIAQQAVPNGKGHSEFLRAQLAISLTLVVKKLSPTADSIAMLYAFSRTVRVAGSIESGKVIVVIQARLKSYPPVTRESNQWAFSKVEIGPRGRVTFKAVHSYVIPLDVPKPAWQRSDDRSMVWCGPISIH
jgi:hypothetical protein